MRVDGERQNMIDFMRLFLGKRSSSFFQVTMAEKNSVTRIDSVREKFENPENRA